MVTDPASTPSPESVTCTVIRVFTGTWMEPAAGVDRTALGAVWSVLVTVIVTDSESCARPSVTENAMV